MGPEGGVHAVLPPATGVLYRVPAPGEGPHVEVGDTLEAERELCSTQTMEPVRGVVPDLPADYPGDGMGEVVEVLAEESGRAKAGQALLRLRPDKA